VSGAAFGARRESALVFEGESAGGWDVDGGVGLLLGGFLGIRWVWGWDGMGWDGRGERHGVRKGGNDNSGRETGEGGRCLTFM
jgi:hypothetical protein